MPGRARRITQLLALKRGNREALDDLIPVVYDELHRLAHYYMSGERSGHLLNTTSLINEAYLRISRLRAVDWRSRKHFFGAAAGVMRRVLVDVARAQSAGRRGGDAPHVQLDEEKVTPNPPDTNLVALDEALKRLEAVDRRKARVIELRFFAGFTVRETAEILEISPDTVMRDWRLARIWLFREIGGVPDSSSGTGKQE